MIELTVLEYLKSKLDIPVEMEKINETEYVLIEKTGSGINNHLNNSTFAIQSYSDSLFNACALNEKVKEAMLGDGESSAGIADLNEISGCKLNSDYNYTDTQTKEYRYQAIFDINHY